MWEVGRGWHALEATCRNLELGKAKSRGKPRLVHRGLIPVAIQVAADGRMRLSPPRHLAAGSHTCLIEATARKWGLHVTASRSVCFGQPDDNIRKEMDAACRLTAVPSPATVGRTAHLATQLIEPAGFGHEWRLAPAGWVTGYAAVELPLTPGTPNRNSAGVRIQTEQPLPAEEKPRTLESGWATGKAAWARPQLTPSLVTRRTANCDSRRVAAQAIAVSGVLVERPDLLVR